MKITTFAALAVSGLLTAGSAFAETCNKAEILQAITALEGQEMSDQELQDAQRQLKEMGQEYKAIYPEFRAVAMQTFKDAGKRNAVLAKIATNTFPWGRSGLQAFGENAEDLAVSQGGASIGKMSMDEMERRLTSLSRQAQAIDTVLADQAALKSQITRMYIDYGKCVSN